MSKAFTKEGNEEAFDPEEGANEPDPLPVGTKNYITPGGLKRLRDEHHRLLDVERPKVVEVVSWAAGNGDRSENADYIYGKRRLREIDKRLRFLGKRIEAAEPVDPTTQTNDSVRFGATVIVHDEEGQAKTYSIVGVDESDPKRGRISWISPLGRSLLKAKVGDSVTVHMPKGEQDLEIISIEYKSLDD
jgi:transcription elongation factor GreB